MLQPKNGDTVLVEAKIVGVSSTGKLCLGAVTEAQVHAILPPPAVPGQTVWWDRQLTKACDRETYAASPQQGVTLLYVHQGFGDNRRWAVAAYGGDIPRCVPFNIIRTTRECAV